MRASITYTRYTIHESRERARTLRIADMQSATGAMYVNARRTINTGSPLRGGVRTSQPYNSLFSFVSLSFFFFFCFRSFVSKCTDAISRAGKRERRRGTANGREKGRGKTTREGYLTNFTLTRAHAHALSLTYRKRDKQKNEMLDD